MLSLAVKDQNEKIAIIGVGCRLPGGADSPGELWRLLAAGRDAVVERPPGRRELWGPDDEPGGAAPPRGGFLPDVAGFDAEFFGVPAREADVMDPQHRLLLEVSWEALEHAGMPPDRLSGTATGVFAGLSYAEYMERLSGSPEELEGAILANGPCVAAGRVSYLLGLTGPCLVVDTACSSSLVAVHLACQALRAGECDTALAGGVSLMLSHRITRSFERVGMLSGTGHCRAFDAAADGFVRGEGCGMVVLRRLVDAVTDGSRILAVVRGSAVNSDGRSDGLAAPSPRAQRALLRQALERSGTDPGDVALIEAHGTGTPVGDPVEFGALAEVYGAGTTPCALTSVKTNLGHLEPAAGISGLIKALLCVGRGQVPPNLHFSRWNPRLSADRTRFFVPTVMTSWPAPARPRIAAVSAFGFSGTNAHVLVEEAPRPSRPSRPLPPQGAPAPSVGPLVFTVPASSRDALPAAARRLADWLPAEGAAVPLADVGYTLSCRRSRGRGRLGVVASSRDELAHRLRAFAAGQVHPGVAAGEVGNGIIRQPVWVFSGQGSQWAGMGAGLLASDAAFATALAEVSELMMAEAGLPVLDLIRAGRPVTACERLQPVLFAMQYALAAMWRAHGVEPAGVIGHSMGEVAAAVVAGALRLSDGVRVIARRSALLSRIAGAGAMASVELDAVTAQAELGRAGAEDSVSVAVLAAPGSTVVAGAPAEVARLVAGWEARGIPARPIAVDIASHCPQVDPLLGDLAETLAGLRPRAPEIPFYSTVTSPGKRPELDAAYWCDNLRRPVRFSAAIAAAATDRHSLYIEVSPHPVVTRAVTDSLAGLVADPVALPTLRRDEDEVACFRAQLAAAHCAGVAVDWAVLYPGGQLADVPSIAFTRGRHWVDGPTREPQHRPGTRPAALPGEHTEVPGDRLRHSWHGDAGTGAIPWLADHQVHGRSVLPGALHAALAITTACEALGTGPAGVEIRSLRFHELLRPAEHTEVKTTLTVTGDDSGQWEAFSRSRDEAGGWTRLASASVRRLPAAAAPPGPLVRPVPDIAGSPASLYDGMRHRGIEHGPAFRAITGLDASGDGRGIWARVKLPDEAAASSGLRVHPVLLDACVQALTAVLVRRPGDRLILPAGVARMTMPGDPATATRAQATITDLRADGLTGDVCLLDAAGRVMFVVEGLELTQSAGDIAADHWFLEPAWTQASRSRDRRAAPSGSWLICADTKADGQSLAAALRAAGAAAEIESLPAGREPVDRAAAGLVRRWARKPAPGALVVLPSRQAPAAEPAAALATVRRLLAVAQATAGSWAELPRLYAITSGAHSIADGDRVSLGDGGVRGLIRVLACEWPGLRATQVDIASTVVVEGDWPATAGEQDAATVALAAELLGGYQQEEVALRGGRRYVARLQYAPLTAEQRAVPPVRTVRYGRDGFRLRAGRLGELRSLELAAVPRRPPGPGEVELRVQAAGVSFRDVLTALGLLGTGDDARGRIGMESAGVVAATGPGVSHLRPGDRALGFDIRGGSFGSFVTMPAASVTALPGQLTTVAAAGIPAAFLTAWYALRHVARVAPGDQVLIHSATGGTGQAAIAVAGLLGADVLATAGSDARRQYLRDQGIKHVMDSRTLDFAAQVREATGGDGVDVVLNSLAGPAIRAGLEALRPFGRFVELGVRDIRADASLGMRPLEHNITLSAVNLIELRQARPELFATLLDEVIAMFADGQLTPLPGPTFPLEEAVDAFTLMAGAGHIGKIVLTVPDDGHATAVIPAANPARADGAYIITGGLAGVGLATARWLALGGAGQVILNGRRGPSAAAEPALAEMRAAGCQVTVVTGDIAESRTAGRLVAAVGGGLRLRGVVHAAMVLDDATIPTITDSQLRRVWRPKVTGAWRLHQATAGQELDWFALYSSMASLLGNPGQGAYAAANAWLDAFAAWRAGLGLPTLAVNWGPWGQTGAATDFTARGYQAIATDDGLRALGTLLAHRRVRTGVLPGPPDSWIPAAARASALLSGLAGHPAGDHGTGGPRRGTARPDPRAELAAMAPGLARRNALESYLAEQIRALLGLGQRILDPDTALRSLGFDSLLSIELSCRLESGLGIKLGPTFVSAHRTLAELTDAIAGQLDLGPADR